MTAAIAFCISCSSLAAAASWTPMRIATMGLLRWAAASLPAASVSRRSCNDFKTRACASACDATLCASTPRSTHFWILHVDIHFSWFPRLLTPSCNARAMSV